MSSNSDTDSESLLTTFKGIKKTCNWCKEYKPLHEGKPYCKDCSAKMHKECTRCHLPYPKESYFEINDRRCNACQKKFLKEKEKRENKKRESDIDSELIHDHSKKQPSPANPGMSKQALKRQQVDKKKTIGTETESVMDIIQEFTTEDNVKKPKLMIIF